MTHHNPIPVRSRGFHRFLAFMLVLGAGLGGLQAGLEVTTRADLEADFESFRTFGWMPEDQRPGSTPGLRNPEAHALFRERVERILSSRGLKMDEDPDLYVIYYMGVQNQGEVKSRNKKGDVRVESYQEGTLILEILPAGTERAIWRAQAVGAIAPPDRLEAQIREMAKKLLKGFPPSR